MFCQYSYGQVALRPAEVLAPNQNSDPLHPVTRGDRYLCCQVRVFHYPTAMQKAIVVQGISEPVRLFERNIPEPDESQILLQVTAASCEYSCVAAPAFCSNS